MIFSVFQKIQVFRYSWSNILWYQFYNLHRSTISQMLFSPICRIFLFPCCTPCPMAQGDFSVHDFFSKSIIHLLWWYYCHNNPCIHSCFIHKKNTKHFFYLFFLFIFFEPKCASSGKLSILRILWVLNPWWMG